MTHKQNMITTNIKPMSANEAYKPAKNRRTGRYIIVSTKEHKRFIRDVGYMLPPLDKLHKKMFARYLFGVSSPLFDADNGVKPFQDCLQNKYGFNDRDIMGHTAAKVLVKKGQEFIKWQLSDLTAYDEFMKTCDWGE